MSCFGTAMLIDVIVGTSHFPSFVFMELPSAFLDYQFQLLLLCKIVYLE